MIEETLTILLVFSRIPRSNIVNYPSSLCVTRMESLITAIFLRGAESEEIVSSEFVSRIPQRQHIASQKCRMWTLSKGTCRGFPWLRIRLPMQGTRVRALVREDPTCRRAAKTVIHNYSACALEHASHNYWARVPQLLKPAGLEPVLRNKRSHHSEKPAHHNKE